MRFELIKTGRAPVEAEIKVFEGFLDNCLEPGRDFERETSLDERLEQLEAFLILPILL